MLTDSCLCDRCTLLRSYDVTSFITHSKQNDGSYLLEMNVSFDEKLPAVEPDGSDGDSGFTTDSEDWNDVDVPLQQ